MRPESATSDDRSIARPLPARRVNACARAVLCSARVVGSRLSIAGREPAEARADGASRASPAEDRSLLAVLGGAHRQFSPRLVCLVSSRLVFQFQFQFQLQLQFAGAARRWCSRCSSRCSRSRRTGSRASGTSWAASSSTSSRATGPGVRVRDCARALASSPLLPASS